MWGKIWGVGEGKRKCGGVKKCGRVYGVSGESVGRGEGEVWGCEERCWGLRGGEKNMGKCMRRYEKNQYSSLHTSPHPQHLRSKTI